MSFHSIPPLNPIDTLCRISKSTLILPIVSVGNIPQLATDLLIHNLHCKLIARLDDDYLYPFASPEDFIEGAVPNTSKISTSLEIYYSDEAKITVLQQRSPVLPGYQNRFLTDLLIPFIISTEFSNVIVLNSATPDSDLAVGPANKRIKLYSNNLASLFTKVNLDDSNSVIESTSEIKDISPSPLSFLTNLIDSLSNEPLYVPMQQTPSEISLIHQLKESFPSSLPLSRASSSIQSIKASQNKQPQTIPIMVLSISSYEGDNSMDLKLLTTELIKILKFDNKSSPNKSLELRTPKSWSGFYGSREAPVGIEGLYS